MSGTPSLPIVRSLLASKKPHESPAPIANDGSKGYRCRTHRSGIARPATNLNCRSETSNCCLRLTRTLTNTCQQRSDAPPFTESFRCRSVMRLRSIAYGRTAHPVTVGMDYRFRRRRCICSKCYRFVTHLNVVERCDNDVATKSYVLCRVIWRLKQQNKRSHYFSWPRRHLYYL